MGALHLGILALAGLSIALSAVAIWRDHPLNWRFALPEPVHSTDAPRFETVFDYTAETGQAHAPAIVLHEDGFSVLWFEGSEEAQADVDIHQIMLWRGAGTWEPGEPAPVITRGRLAGVFEPRQLVVTLGNTIENEAINDRLFATVVSVGGWAMASVADVRMGRSGPDWARKLNLSPFLNRSFLVKSPMVDYADGSKALPAYFEMGSTYGALVRMDDGGRVRDVRRMAGKGMKPIQPMIVPLDETRAVAFLRDFDPSRELLISRTEDGGQSWSEVASTDIPNPSAPVAALALGGGRILMAANDDPNGGDGLRLLLSEDEGISWQGFHILERNGSGARYPMLRRLPGDEIALAYSVGNKRGIRAIVFNEAWVAAQ